MGKKKNKKQEFLFDDLERDWEKDWQDMPEFIQERKTPFQKIIVRFETKEDLDDFSKLIGHQLTVRTKAIWYPYKGIRRKDKIWKSES